MSGQDCVVPTPSGKTQAKRPLTAKELRAVRKRRREREKTDRKAEGIRSLWSLPSGQPVRRNYILSLVGCVFIGMALAFRLSRMGMPAVGAIIIGGVVWAVVTTFVAWSARKAFPY